SAQIREILISESAWEEMTCLFALSLGVSILPASFARVRVDGVRYLPLVEPDATTEVWLVHHRRRPLTAAAQALMALMLK
ncbi:LysR substrate-binding domain-containing protein, partial [Serratia marcescens]|uniref:LysR substrate-binding domain-containing protein n=1 Tax=Serratia marcescens TaxID=615 RepID=UPI0025AA9364